MNARRVLVLLFVFTLANGARADSVDKIFGLLKKTFPNDADAVEFARYYVRQPDHASVIYSRIAGQDYVFAAILGAAKAAKDQPILPGGKTFGYQQCRLPLNLFDAAFAQNDKFIKEYGQDDNVKAYLSGQSEELKAQAFAELAQYVPYLSDVEAICHFTFNTSFKTEEEIRKAAGSGWQLMRGIYEDLASGNVAAAVEKMIANGFTADAACSFADSAITGGVISKTPVVGSLARQTCAGFAGTVIKGIASAVGGAINAVGEFIGDAGCTTGIGSCSDNQPLNTLFNRNFELLVYQYAVQESVDPDQWTTHWWNTIQHDRCRNATGASDAACEQTFNQVVASAKTVAAKLRLEPGPAYASIYKPSMDRLARYDAGPQAFLVAQLDAQCVDNLVSLYPWPGPQQADAKFHNEVFRRLCGQARSRGDVAGGTSFDQQLADRSAFFKKALDTTGCEGNASRRVCRTYPSQYACATVFQNFGVPRGATMGKTCVVDDAAAKVALAKRVSEKAPRCQQSTLFGIFLANCTSYEDHAACVKTVRGTSGAPASLYLGCRLDRVAAKKQVIDSMSANLGIGRIGSRPAADGCTLDGSTFRCGGKESFAKCKSLLSEFEGMPAGAVRCYRNVVLGGGTTIPDPGERKTIPYPGGRIADRGQGKSGGRTTAPPRPEGPAGDVEGSLAKRGCSESPTRPGHYGCTSKAGYDACQEQRKKGRVTACTMLIRRQ